MPTLVLKSVDKCKWDHAIKNQTQCEWLITVSAAVIINKNKYIKKKQIKLRQIKEAWLKLMWNSWKAALWHWEALHDASG